jgi:hypothetical protein
MCGELERPGEVTAMAYSKIIFWLLYSHEGNAETHGILQSKYLAPTQDRNWMPPEYKFHTVLIEVAFLVQTEEQTPNLIQ